MQHEQNEGRIGFYLVLAMVVLAFGHTLSTLLRTLPAVAVDVMAPDLGIDAPDMASLTAVYHFAFAACQLPVGVALDRFSIRSVALMLFAGTLLGALLAATATGPVSFLIAQLVLGVATSGMLMCPMTLAAKRVTPGQFGLWSGIILSLGNMGMLLSASPLAWVVESYGWRVGFGLAAVLAVLTGVAVLLYVPADKPAETQSRALLPEMIAMARLAMSPTLRGLVVLSLPSLAVMLVFRGLWAGPWLMDIKGLSRLEAGNVLFIFTLAVIAGPFVIGAADRRFGNRRTLVTAAHLASAVVFMLIAAGGPGNPVSALFGLDRMPVPYDIGLLIVLGMVVCGQALIYAMARQAVSMDDTGKALSATNLAMFLGTAMMQSATDPIAAKWGLPSVLLFMAGCLVVGTLLFVLLTRPGPSDRPAS